MPESFQNAEWWPNGKASTIYAGIPGHDREIVINIDGYSVEEPIPELVAKAIANGLPESWKVENRGSRIEVHPSGSYNGGWNEQDIEATRIALVAIGTRPASRVVSAQL
jgi:hypothetical protein